MELLELIVYLLEAIAEIGTLFEKAERNVFGKCIGWVGLLVANMLTWGRVDWETNDWRSITLGLVTLAGIMVLVAKGCVHAVHSTHSTSCVLTLRCSVA